MKTQLLCGTLLSCLAIQMSCSDDNEKENNMSVSGKLRNVEISADALYSTHHTISQKDAENYALKMANLLLDGEESGGLKRTVSRSVGDVSVIRASQSSLKSANTKESDTLAYVVNFANDNGYALVSADDRSTTKVLACIETGSYNPNSKETAAMEMIERAQQVIVNDIDNFENYKDAAKCYYDSTSQSQLKSTVKQESVLESSGPYITNIWGQGHSTYDYNLYCSKCSNCNRSAAVGCVNLSIAQIMSYYKWPTKLSDGQFLNWSKINQYNAISKLSAAGRKHLQYLLGFLQLSNIKNEDLICCEEHGGTATYDSNISNFAVLKDYGYKCEVISDPFNHLTKNHKPLYISNQRVYGGHAWIVDGYKKVSTVTKNLTVNSKGEVVSTSSSSVYKSYIHHNWGWYGRNNGYFILGCYNTNPNNSEDVYFDNLSSNNCFYDLNLNLRFVYIHR